VRRIAPEPKDDTPVSAEQLVRLAHFITGRLFLECPGCGTFQRLKVGARQLRIGSSPDLSALDPNQISRPRLVFACAKCQRVLGYVQGDEWDAVGPGADGGDAPTRWDRLELYDDEEKPET
jgi:hypothetical protein